MPFLMSQASLPSFEMSLNALSAILDKAAANAAAKKSIPQCFFGRLSLGQKNSDFAPYLPMACSRQVSARHSRGGERHPDTIFVLGCCDAHRLPRMGM